MKIVEHKLEDIEYEHIKKIEFSLNKYSKEHMTASLMARNLLNMIGSLHDARQQIIQRKIEELKINTDKIVDMAVENGILKINLNEE